MQCFFNEDGVHLEKKRMLRQWIYVWYVDSESANYKKEANRILQYEHKLMQSDSHKSLDVEGHQWLRCNVILRKFNHQTEQRHALNLTRVREEVMHLTLGCQFLLESST